MSCILLMNVQWKTEIGSHCMYFTGIFLTESKAVCISFANSAVLQYFCQTTVNYFFEQKK